MIRRIRNIGIAAHVDAGKTTLTERILHAGGRIRRVGEVHHGTTTTDHLPEERAHGITIASAATYTHWPYGGEAYTVNLIDTPGHVDFTIEVERSLRVLDGAVAVLDASQGVEPQTETVWRQADRHGVPRIAFVNKMDKVGADFGLTVRELREKLGATPLVVHLPLGAEREFGGVIDVVARCGWTFEDGQARRVDLDPECLEQAEQARARLIEALAEHDETLLAAYLEGSEVGEAQLVASLRERTLRLEGTPVLCGSALAHMGVTLVLDAVVAYLPSPLDVPAARATSNDQERSFPADPDGDLLALAFKITTDPFGRLSFVRVYSGTLEAGSYVLDATTGERERVTRVLRMHAGHEEDIPALRAGEIGAVRGPKRLRTGDTLVAGDAVAWQLAGLTVPEPVVSRALETRDAAGHRRLVAALSRLVEEDPTLRLAAEPETGRTLLSGMGELHLEMVMERVNREQRLDARLGDPSVAYRETVSREATVDHVLRKQSGGSGQFAAVTVRVEPLGAGQGAEFVDATVGGSVPRTYLGSVQRGTEAALQAGPLGHPVVDVRVTLLGGRHHPVDSSDLAFQTAATEAVRLALSQAGPVLLEPVMRVEVTAPAEFVGTVVGDLSARRGLVQGLEARGTAQVVRARVPLAELFGYATALRSLTQGRASFSMVFEAYAPA